MPDTSPVRLAFVGISHPHAHAWAKAAHDRDDTLISAVYDPDPHAAKTFAASYTAPVVSLHAVTAGKYAAAVIDGRNDQAQVLALTALHAGLPLFIEKTGGMSSRELQAVADAAEARGLLTQMGYFLRYSEAVSAARDAITSGSLGTLTLARFHCAIPHQAWTTMGTWFADPTNVVGGFMEAGCHMVDIVRHLLGEPTAVSAKAVPGRCNNHAEASLSASLQFEDYVASLDFTAHEANTWNENWTIELYGTEATFRAGLLPAWAQTNQGTYCWNDILSPPPDAERKQKAQQENILLMQRGMNFFLQSLRGNSLPPVDAANGAATLRLIENIYASARAEPTPASQPHHLPAHSR